MLCFSTLKMLFISQIGHKTICFFSLSKGHIWRVHPLPRSKLRTQKVHENCIPLCNINLDMLLIFVTQKSKLEAYLVLVNFQFQASFLAHSFTTLSLWSRPDSMLSPPIYIMFRLIRLDTSWNQNSGTLIGYCELGSACSSNNHQTMTGLMIWLRLRRLPHNLISL